MNNNQNPLLPDEYRETAEELVRNWFSHPDLRIFVRAGCIVGLRLKDDYYVALPYFEIQKISPEKAALYFDDVEIFVVK
jgi:hypothetical protein